MGAFQVNVTLWEDGKIPYILGNYHPFYKIIKAAITEINNKTVLRMVERTTEPNYIEFVYFPDQCNYSSVGMVGGRQEINIKHNVRVLHEIGHAIGLIHEHQRPDRDHYLQILRDNVSHQQHNFFEESFYQKDTDVAYCTPYDLDSCMHYWSTCAGKEKNLLERLRSSVEGESFIGYYKTWVPLMGDTKRNYETSEVLSYYDISCINNFYRQKFPNINNLQ